jgi:hypothetical protein
LLDDYGNNKNTKGMKSLIYFFILVDWSFIAYWLITALHLIPAEFLFNDYNNPILVNWNWSFFPLDILVSFSGIYSLYLNRKNNPSWKLFAMISLILTSVSGLQAISYWVLARDFDLSWWIPNLFLLFYPLFYLPKIIREISDSIKSESIRYLKYN